VLVRGFSESDGISVAIYGGEARRVESSATPLVATGAVPVQRIPDASLPKGERVVEEEGAAPTRTSATRMVYDADGKLLRSETWNTSYEAEKRIVRIGTKVAEPKPKIGEVPPADEVAPPPGKGGTTPPKTRP
jgi:uncharacterized protein YabE (DUF348 family)